MTPKQMLKSLERWMKILEVMRSAIRELGSSEPDHAWVSSVLNPIASEAEKLENHKWNSYSFLAEDGTELELELHLRVVPSERQEEGDNGKM